MVQIIGYVTASEAREFQKYAESFHLNSAPIATLIIARELQLKRLTSLIEEYSEGRSNGERKKIVAHQTTDALKKAFKDHVDKCGLKPSSGAAILFRAELRERWLSTAARARNFDSS